MEKGGWQWRIDTLGQEVELASQNEQDPMHQECPLVGHAIAEGVSHL
jgi:hypothetical protein